MKESLFVKQIVLIFALVRTVLLTSILSLVRTVFLSTILNLENAKNLKKS